MDIINPNLQWYLKQSTLKGISPRCSFANVRSCPRFYQSLSLLGRAGSTKISEKEDLKLSKKWKRSFLLPVTEEQSTSISGPKDNYKHFWNFCPEVAYEHFGLFATHLEQYADEIDTGCAHSQLARVKAPTHDWRWSWSNVQSQHYSECQLYSVLLGLKSSKNNHEDIIELKPNLYGIGLNFNALIRRIKGCLINGVRI